MEAKEEDTTQTTHQPRATQTGEYESTNYDDNIIIELVSSPGSFQH